MSNIRDYWESSDALFHSEAGVPGASSLELINKYKEDCSILPILAENPFWGQFSWWIESEEFEKELGYFPEDVSEYIHWQQQRQSKGLSIALESAKRRFPKCGGFVIWMGHDCFPCPANTSIFDFEGAPKPIVAEVRRIWRN